MQTKQIKQTKQTKQTMRTKQAKQMEQTQQTQQQHAASDETDWSICLGGLKLLFFPESKELSGSGPIENGPHPLAFHLPDTSTRSIRCPECRNTVQSILLVMTS